MRLKSKQDIGLLKDYMHMRHYYHCFHDILNMIVSKDKHMLPGKPFRLKSMVLVGLLLCIALFTITFPVMLLESEPEQDFILTKMKDRHINRLEHFEQRDNKVWNIIHDMEQVMEEDEYKYLTSSRLAYGTELLSILGFLINSTNNTTLQLGHVVYNGKAKLDYQFEQHITNMGVVLHKIGLATPNKSLTWKHLYPEWIDEEQVYEVPKCPSFPMPKIHPSTKLDVVFVELPCIESSDWRRDIHRLHLQLSVARVVVDTNSSYAILYTKCHPFLNLFTCKDLILRNHDVWLYKPNLQGLRRKLNQPIGSCELAIPLNENEATNESFKEQEEKRVAYATILHSADLYVCGAIALAQSIRKSGSIKDMVILVDENIEEDKLEGLTNAGWITLKIERIRNPHASPNSYNEWNYSKLRLWQLTSYEKIIFVDSDVLILRNIDFLFDLEEISASGNARTIFNSGIMLVEPSVCTFEFLMKNIEHILSYNGGDQGFLNEMFTWWHRLPQRMNFLKHFYSNSIEEFEEKTKLFGMDPPMLYVLHFLGYKPWLCFRDFDCSSIYPQLKNYVSDVAHNTWWKYHDMMPVHLQRFCQLSLNQTESLVFDMEFYSFQPKQSILDPRFYNPI